MMCPFCGKKTDSHEQCSKCHTLFNEEIRAIAYQDERRSDRIGPLSTKTAKILLWIFMALLLLAFVATTEWWPR